MKKVRVIATMAIVLLLIGGIEIKTVEPDVCLKEQEHEIEITIAEKVFREAGRFIVDHFYPEPVAPSWTAGEILMPYHRIPRTASGSAMSAKKPVS